MIKFWIITITKRIGRDEAVFVHENKVFTDKNDAYETWNQLEHDSNESVDLVECSGKTIESK